MYFLLLKKKKKVLLVKKNAKTKGYPHLPDRPLQEESLGLNLQQILQSSTVKQITFTRTFMLSSHFLRNIMKK